MSKFFHKDMRTPEKMNLVQAIEASEREFVAGKGKKLHSLKDLM